MKKGFIPARIGNKPSAEHDEKIVNMFSQALNGLEDFRRHLTVTNKQFSYLSLSLQSFTMNVILIFLH